MRRSMLDTRLSNIFELILDQAARTPSARLPSSALASSCPGRAPANYIFLTGWGCSPATPLPRIPGSATSTIPASCSFMCQVTVVLKKRPRYVRQMFRSLRDSSFPCFVNAGGAFLPIISSLLVISCEGLKAQPRGMM